MFNNLWGSKDIAANNRGFSCGLKKIEKLLEFLCEFKQIYYFKAHSLKKKYFERPPEYLSYFFHRPFLIKDFLRRLFKAGIFSTLTIRAIKKQYSQRVKKNRENIIV